MRDLQQTGSQTKLHQLYKDLHLQNQLDKLRTSVKHGNKKSPQCNVSASSIYLNKWKKLRHYTESVTCNLKHVTL